MSKSLRDTSSGAKFERVVEFPLTKCFNVVIPQQYVGFTPDGKTRHRIDVLAYNSDNPEDNPDKHLFSCKYQRVLGTAEEKLYSEVIRLMIALENPRYTDATIILGGDGFTKELVDYIRDDFIPKKLKISNIYVYYFEDFLTRLNLDSLSHSQSLEMYYDIVKKPKKMLTFDDLAA